MIRFIYAIIICLFVNINFSLAESEKPLNKAQKQTILREVSDLLTRSYVYPETAAKMIAHVTDRMNRGEYDSLNDPHKFAATVSEDLRSISKDKHLGFEYNPEQAAGLIKLEGQDESEKRKVQESFQTQAKRDNFGFRKVERLPGNIGYLDFRYFASADQSAPTAIAALGFLANCDAVIIDLRQNGGGDPTLIQLISSYFFPKPTHLNDIYSREEDSTENFWTFPWVPGSKLENADLYVLTSSFTFSGAEEFTYNVKNLKRATIIGETTGGGAHPVNQKVVAAKYVLGVPFARAINPITKTNWEGTGITPDITLPAAKAYDKAYQLALEKLAAKTTDKEKKSELDWLRTVQEAKMNPMHLDPSTLKKYAGVYEERKVTLENGELYYQRRGPKFKLVPVNQTMFIAEGVDDVHFEFVMKGEQATEIIGIYSDGSREPSKRSN